LEAANEHMDALGVPDDSVIRGVVDIQLACNANPILKKLITQCWPTAETMLEQRVDYLHMKESN
jgi:hypothetical protein